MLTNVVCTFASNFLRALNALTKTESAPPSEQHNSPTTQPASLFRRLGALVYDTLLILAIWMVTAAVMTLLNKGHAVNGAWFQSLLLLESYVFFAWFWLHNRATLGMQAWHMHLQTLTGPRLTLQQTLIRFLVAIFALLPFGLGYLWILFDPAKRSWHDIASDTRIVYTPRPPK